MVSRRNFLKSGIAAGVAANLPFGWAIREAGAVPARAGLSDPAYQFLHAGFVNAVPDALSPGFIYQPDKKGRYKIGISTAVQQVGLVDALLPAVKLSTPVWGYGDRKDRFYSWPGRTFQVQSGPGETEVFWANQLNGVTAHLLPADTSTHWCYSLHGYTQNTIANAGVPIITHLHGGNSDFQFDGNPEFFYNPDETVTGPQWANVPGGFTTKFRYNNNVPAGNLWYHDHALGITRLNVYAGMAGFYFVRDDMDTGNPGNSLGVPAWPYEKAYAIQDRMFLETGELFYPAFPGDPFYDDFITAEGAVLPANVFPGGGPTALAEFFGDHMVVNGVIWPKEIVEPRNYRMHLLNGTDSRFMALQLWEVPAGEKDLTNAIGQIPFTVIGSDQGLASSPTVVETLVSEPGSRYDVIVDFKLVTPGNRVIMKNIGGDEPFGGDIPGPQIFGETDRVMAFDVEASFGFFDGGQTGETTLDESMFPALATPASDPTVTIDRTGVNARKVALFEGKDEYGRLQPLLGTAEPATDELGVPINWPVTPVYQAAGLTGQMDGSIAWHSPTTENPQIGATEDWQIWNVTGDGHPVHLHLVKFEIMERREIIWDSATNADDRVLDPTGVTAPVPNGDGTYLVTQTVIQHNSTTDPATWGTGFRIVNPTFGAVVPQPAGYVENAPKDMVTALPDQVTIIKTHFDKPGRYVWHCHILSHEDHEMMRVLHVGPGA